MAKLVDYCISAVRYDSERKHIAYVRVHGGELISKYTEWTRSQVVSYIDGGKTFVTIMVGNDGKWYWGKDVHIVKVNGVKYIRTDANSKGSDNLENLPEF